MDDLADFRKPLDSYLHALEDRQQAFVSTTGAVNHHVYEPRLGQPNYQDVPCCLYFYYVRINDDGKLHVTHHFYPGGDPNDGGHPADPADWPPIPPDPQRLEAIVRELALDARPTGAGKYPVIGTSFQNVVWRRRSYIAIFVDEANWQLHRASSGREAVVFVTGTNGGQVALPNHSFFDAMDFGIQMPISGSTQTDQRTAIVFVNHMKADEAGNELGGGAGQYFEFKMFFDAAFASGGTGMTVILDPGGTNMGPPIEP